MNFSEVPAVSLTGVWICPSRALRWTILSNAAEYLTSSNEYVNNGVHSGVVSRKLRPKQQPAGPFLEWGSEIPPGGGRHGFREGQFRRRQRAVAAGRRGRAGRRNARNRRDRGRGTGDRGRRAGRASSGAKARAQAGRQEASC